MSEYDFTLKYRLASSSENAEVYLEALAESGCDDALVGTGQNGKVSLNFIRSAETAFDAISTAISDVQQAIPDALLVEATPDFVGISDIAEMYGFSRQYMRKLIQLKGASFPEPVHEGKPSLWHLADILLWFRHHESKDMQQELFDTSQVNRQLNILKSCLKAAFYEADSIASEAYALNKNVQPTPATARLFVHSLRSFLHKNALHSTFG